MKVVNTIVANLLEAYSLLMSLLPPFAQNFINLFLIVLLIVVYSVFIWKFYRFIATKNIIELDLTRYNHASHPTIIKLIAGGLYLIEYLLILPFLIFFWFVVFTLFLIFLTENLEISNLLIIAATIIAAIRMLSYYKEGLAKEVAKLVPFTLLAISILNPKFFDIERILVKVTGIPGFFNNIIIYLAFIIILEIILRFFDFVFSLFGLNEEIKETEED